MSEQEAGLLGLRKRFYDGADIVGTFVGINAPSAIEMVARAGFDVVCIDAEHGALGIGDVAQLVRAADSRGAAPMVRVPDLGIDISRVLDAGAKGVVVPRVETAEQAAHAVALARYPSEGVRGAGPGRAADYGYSIGPTIANANREVAIVVQIETRAGVANAAAIAATPGLDAVFIGPGDLSVTLGVAPGSDEHSSAIAEICAAAHASEQRLGIYVGDPTDIPRYRELGISFFLVQSDATFLLAQAAAIRSEISSSRD